MNDIEREILILDLFDKCPCCHIAVLNDLKLIFVTCVPRVSIPKNLVQQYVTKPEFILVCMFKMQSNQGHECCTRVVHNS